MLEKPELEWKLRVTPELDNNEESSRIPSGFVTSGCHFGILEFELRADTISISELRDILKMWMAHPKAVQKAVKMATLLLEKEDE